MTKFNVHLFYPRVGRVANMPLGDLQYLLPCEASAAASYYRHPGNSSCFVISIVTPPVKLRKHCIIIAFCR